MYLNGISLQKDFSLNFLLPKISSNFGVSARTHPALCQVNYWPMQLICNQNMWLINVITAASTSCPQTFQNHFQLIIARLPSRRIKESKKAGLF